MLSRSLLSSFKRLSISWKKQEISNLQHNCVYSHLAYSGCCLRKRWSSTHQMMKARLFETQVQLSSIVDDLLALFQMLQRWKFQRGLSHITYYEIKCCDNHDSTAQGWNVLPWSLQNLSRGCPWWLPWLSSPSCGWCQYCGRFFEKAIVLMSKCLPLSEELKQAAALLLKCGEGGGGNNVQPGCHWLQSGQWCYRWGRRTWMKKSTSKT